MGGGKFEATGERWTKKADEFYGAGEVIRLAPHEDRSGRSHNHYFACVAEAHANLPDDMAINFPTEDHLRKYALIRTGYCTTNVLVLNTPEEARKAAVFMRTFEQFGVIKLSGCSVMRFTPHSQSKRAMNKETFARSKTDVLAFLATLIGSTVEDLRANSGKSGGGER